jgi:predicted N-acetyltransferase YhbS
MATDPEYQGKGLGKALVQWGCEQADEEGVPAYTEATAAGRPLYAKLGFELLEELTTDVMHEGSLVKYSIMLRKPKRKVEQMSED